MAERLPAGVGTHITVMSSRDARLSALLSQLQVVNWSSTVQDPESSTQSQSSSKPQLRMAVPAGRLELGQLLLKSMYQVKPDFADLQQELWLPLLVLADKYAVPKVITALCISFRDAYLKLAWDTVAGFYSLPDVIRNSQQCQTIRDAVKNKLGLECGDLELVWASEEKQKLLLQLPLAAIEWMLLSPVTKVASENTAAYSVLRWAAAQPTTASLQKQLQQLCSLLRMRNCSQLFIATVLSTDKKISSCLSMYEWQIAALCSSQQGFALNPDNDVLKKHPAWRRSARQCSSCTSLVIDCRVKLSTIEQLYKECSTSKARSQMLLSSSKLWRGRSLALGVQLSPTNTTSSVPHVSIETSALAFSEVGLDLHLVLQGDPREMARVTYNLVVEATPGDNAPKQCRYPSPVGNASQNVSVNGRCGHCMLRVPKSDWPAAEACLRNAHLVHSDSCVVFSAHVINIE